MAPNVMNPATVPFNVEIIQKCRCPGCPVQAQSKCVAGLKPDLTAALKEKPLKRERIPGVYCSTGKATCTDLDASKKCICGECPVFTEYGLAEGKIAGYFCRDGASR